MLRNGCMQACQLEALKQGLAAWIHLEVLSGLTSRIITVTVTVTVTVTGYLF
jgi:hypothetical protein